MIVRDPEVLDALGDKPELLALADAVAETQRQARSSRVRRAAPRALIAAGAVAAAVIVIQVVPRGGGNHGIVDRALAAIGGGRVLHIVTESPTGTVFVDLKSGRRTIQTVEYEAWFDRRSNRFHLIMRLRGRVVGDVLLPDDAQRNNVDLGEIDPAFAALWSGYREALASGKAKLERQGVLAGRRVYWLRFPSFQRGLPGTEVAIDKRTFKPVLFRTYSSRTRHVDEHVLVAETTTLRASDFTRRGPSLFAGVGESTLSGGSSSQVAPPRHPVVKRPWVTPGNQVAGLKLIAVNRTTMTSHRRTIHGVELLYGTRPQRFPPLGTPPLTIEELPRPDEPRFWKRVPRGSIQIQSGEASEGKRTYAQWTGYVRSHGVYVTITTRRGERFVVAAARALHLAR